MSYSVRGTKIQLTRGDTLRLQVSIKDGDGNQYVPADGDKIRFAMKKDYDGVLIINKSIPNDSLELTLNPKDTKDLDVGKYVYDVELTKENGDVDTFITCATLQLTEEVY